MAKIQIIVGSVMGTAEEVATAIAEELTTAGHQVRINPSFTDSDQAGDLADDSEVLLLCTSNTGMGDLPANIAPLYAHLTGNFPRIAGRRYGVVNLGDSSYPNFAEAGQTLDEAMADIGAVRVGEPFVMDAIMVDDYPAEARDWARQWSSEL